MLKKSFMKLAAVANVIKLKCNLHSYWHMSLGCDRGYAARRVNYAEKSFRILAPVANFIKLFWCNLCHYRSVSLSFDRGYAARSVNYAKKVLGNWHQWPIL
jgi:hypothetical protein